MSFVEDLTKRYEQMLNSATNSYKTEYQCLKCKDTGWVNVIENGHTYVAICPCAVAKKIKQLWSEVVSLWSFRQRILKILIQKITHSL